MSKGRSNMWRARMCISLRAWKTHLTGFVTPPSPQKVRYFPLINKKWGRFKSSPSLGLMTILNVLDTITNSFTQPTTKRWAWTTKPEMGNFANNHESDTDEGETRVKTRRSLIEKKCGLSPKKCFNDLVGSPLNIVTQQNSIFVKCHSETRLWLKTVHHAR